MSRTPLFAAVKKALARSARDNHLVLPPTSALTRRRLLRLSAAAAGAAGPNDAKSALDAFRADLPKMSKKMAESLDPSAVTSFFWATYPYTLGSYATPKPGQHTTFFDVAAEPALDGRVQFAGDRTSVDFFGFMNAAFESGDRAAAALIEAMALKE